MRTSAPAVRVEGGTWVHNAIMLCAHVAAFAHVGTTRTARRAIVIAENDRGGLDRLVKRS